MIFDHATKTNKRQEMIDITGLVVDDIKAADLSDGLCVIFVTHTTAALTVNENADPDVVRDLLTRFKQLAPENDGYHHLEGNSDAHILSSLIGCSLNIPVTDGKLSLGTWQGLYFVELDGPRKRHFKVKLIAG